jgi:hypothetical protein
MVISDLPQLIRWIEPLVSPLVEVRRTGCRPGLIVALLPPLSEELSPVPRGPHQWRTPGRRRSGERGMMGSMVLAGTAATSWGVRDFRRELG